MKTMKRIMAMFFVAATMVFAACGDKDNESDDPQRPPEGIDLTGRSWEGSINSTYNYQGMVDMNIDANIVMEFLNTTEGTMNVHFILDVPAFPTMNREDEQSTPVTYTFDGHDLHLVPSEEATEEGFLGEMTMTYDETNNTFIMEVPDENYEGINLREVLGTDHVVFYEVVNPQR